jgi:hypothetical protein
MVKAKRKKDGPRYNVRVPEDEDRAAEKTAQLLRITKTHLIRGSVRRTVAEVERQLASGIKDPQIIL